MTLDEKLISTFKSSHLRYHQQNNDLHCLKAASMLCSIVLAAGARAIWASAALQVGIILACENVIVFFR